jgi:hypothetical protein
MAEARWLSGSDALALMRHLDASGDAQQELVTLCADRIVHAQCNRYVHHNPASPEFDVNEIGRSAIPYTFWRDATLNCNWSKAVFSIENYDSLYGTTTSRFYGVEFRGDEIVTYLRGDGAQFDDHWPIKKAPPAISSAPPPIPKVTRHEMTLTDWERSHGYTAKVPTPPRVEPGSRVSLGHQSWRPTPLAPPTATSPEHQELLDLIEAERRALLDGRPKASPAKPKPKPKASPGKRGPPDFSAFQAWVDALSSHDRARGWRWLYPAAKEHFHPRRVPKEWVLELVRGRDRGRPKGS